MTERRLMRLRGSSSWASLIHRRLLRHCKLFFCDIQLVTKSGLRYRSTFKPQRQGSVSDLTYLINHSRTQPTRVGAIASFANFPALVKGFDKVVSLLPPFNASDFATRHGGNNQPPNVVNIALRIFDSADDMSESEWSARINSFVNERIAILNRYGVRRISFVMCRKAQYPWYYTLRDSQKYLPPS